MEALFFCADSFFRSRGHPTEHRTVRFAGTTFEGQISQGRAIEAAQDSSELYRPNVEPFGMRFSR